MDRSSRGGLDQSDREGEAFVKELGKEFVDLPESEQSALVAAMDPIYAEYIRSTEEKGLPGEAFLKDLLALLK